MSSASPRKLSNWRSRVLLHGVDVDPPRVHDVADILEAERDRLPPAPEDHVDRLAAASRSLRRDRELAFDGTPDIVPSGFYRESDAAEARETAQFVVRSITTALRQDRDPA